jgi:putative CocE/NonD family hydrolase
VNNPGSALHQMLIIPWLLSDGQTSIASEQGLDLDEMFAYKPLRDAIPGNADIFRDNKIDLSGVSKNQTKFNYKNVNIPVFHINGWYDFTIQSTIDAFSELHKNSKTKQQLVLGPWYHNQIYDDNNEIGDYILPDSGVMQMNELLELSVKWFDNTLRNKPANRFDEKIKYYVLFEDEWHNSKQWPPKHGKEELFLGSNNSLTYKKTKSLNSESSFSFNPEKPTPTLGGANFYFFADKMGIKNQKEIESRDDVLIFTSQSFDENKIVAGNIALDLFIKTEGKSTDFTAKLTVVDTNGTSRNIVDGIIRVSSNNLNDSVSKIKIDLGDTAFKVLRGEKLRLQISSSNYPKFNRNPNTGEDPLDALEYIEVEQTILHSKKYPSKLILPILKN